MQMFKNTQKAHTFQWYLQCGVILNGGRIGREVYEESLRKNRWYNETRINVFLVLGLILKLKSYRWRKDIRKIRWTTSISK